MSAPEVPTATQGLQWAALWGCPMSVGLTMMGCPQNVHNGEPLLKCP